MEYRELKEPEVTESLLADFDRRQQVTLVWRRNEASSRWSIVPRPSVDDWSAEERRSMVDYLKNTAVTGGLVLAAMGDGSLLGFASVESAPLGADGDYLDLSTLHVSASQRNQGIGTTLFMRAAGWARAHGAKKLYISTHPAIESQGFYLSLGCVDAAEPQQDHMEKEPGGRQLEYAL